MNIALQFQTIAFMSACGVLMGMGFDTYQVFRKKGRFPRWLVFFLDLGYWVASLGLVFLVLLRVNDGVVRFPVLLGIVFGVGVYFVLVSKMYIQFLLAMIKFCLWLYRTIVLFVQVVILRPMRFLYQLIAMILAFLFSFLLAIGRVLWKTVLFFTAPFAAWGRNMGKGFRQTGAGFGQRVKKWMTWKRKRE